VGWWSSSGAGDSTRTPEDVRKEHDFARAYLNFHDDSEINWVMIRAVLASVADVAIVPLQDVLGLGSAARYESSGHGQRKLKWRLSSGRIERRVGVRLRSLVNHVRSIGRILEGVLLVHDGDAVRGMMNRTT